MQSEQIRVGEKTKSAEEIVVPDILFLGVMVSKEEQTVVEFAYRSAIRVHMLILTRERSRNAVKQQFTVDIPDLGFIAKTLRKHERDELAGFLVVFQALVSHFLPKAVVEPYSCDGRSVAGMRYRGMAWVSNSS
jgi:hypothetical protein